MREFIVTKLVCAKCGRNLTLNCDVPKNAGQYAEGDPTGADMVQSIIAVDPCQCSTRPLDEMREAVKVLLGT